MLKDIVFGPAMKTLASQVISVMRMDGNLCFLVGYCKLAAATVCDSYPVSRVYEYIHSLRASNLFSILNANSGYGQIELDKNDMFEIAFVTQNGLYRDIRMSFGIEHALAAF